MQDVDVKMGLYKLIQKIIKSLITVFMFFLILETALQITSLIQNKILNRQISVQKVKNIKNDKHNQQVSILCVGDSFTQGVGASNRDYSYPMQLQRYLKKNYSYIIWKVFNCGVACTNSSELVHFLPAILDYYSSDYLCVLVGINDFWNYNLVEESPSNLHANSINNQKVFIPWRLRFRTSWFFSMILKYFQDIKAAKENLPNKKTNNFDIVHSQIKDSEDIQALFNHGRKLLSENRPGEAREIFTKVLMLDPNYLDAQIQLAFAFIAQKRIDEALKHAHLIREKILNKPSPLHIHLAWVFIKIEEFQYAHDEIEQFNQYYPNDLETYEAMGAISSATYDYNTAESYFKKVIESNSRRAFSYRSLARIYILRDNRLEEAVKLLIQAYLLDKDVINTELYLSVVNSVHPTSIESFREILNKFKTELEIDLNSYKKLCMIGEKVINKVNVKSILKKNLSEIASLCLQYKTTPVFITYPMNSEINQVIRDFCGAKNEHMIDAEELFKDSLKANNSKKYFLPDNHLNNEGYSILAERIGELFINRISVQEKEN